MPGDTLYDTDFYAWSQQQAAFMRKGAYTAMDVNWMPGGRQPSPCITPRAASMS